MCTSTGTRASLLYVCSSQPIQRDKDIMTASLTNTCRLSGSNDAKNSSPGTSSSCTRPRWDPRLGLDIPSTSLTRQLNIFLAHISLNKIKTIAAFLFLREILFLCVFAKLVQRQSHAAEAQRQGTGEAAIHSNAKLRRLSCPRPFLIALMSGVRRRLSAERGIKVRPLLALPDHPKLFNYLYP